METKNIRQRALSWTEIVNLETSRINSMLDINLNNYNYNNDPQNNLYLCNVPNPLKYLTFLSEWNGIKTRNTSSQPSNYLEFEAKAKNWLNGRRAPNYGNTLFPDMIKSSYNYSNSLSLLIFGNVPIDKLSAQPNGDSLQNLYHKTLLFAYLSKLCSQRIAVHQSWKKTNLLCENSVKNMHSNTAKLLQQYAIHDYTKNDLNSFPGNLQRSAAFFSEQHSQYLSRLMRAYNDRNENLKQQAPHNNMMGRNVSMRMPEMMSRSGSSSRHDLNVNYVAIKSSQYARIMERLSALERKHNDQANQISTLTTKCLVLQSHFEANNAPSTIASVPSCGGAMHQYVDKLSSNENDYNDCNIPSITSSHSTYTQTQPQPQPQHAPQIHSIIPNIPMHTVAMPMPMPTAMPMHMHMPFQPSRSVPPRPIIKHPDRKFDVTYPNAPQITSSTSTPMNTNNNNNYNTYNYDDYGLSLNNIPTFDAMYPRNNRTQNSQDNNITDHNMGFLSGSTPHSNTNNLSLNNSFLSDHVMFDHDNSNIFAYSPLNYTP
jgi:hypothetical protein